MRLWRIFLLHFQDTITEWSRSIVWLLIPLINGSFFMLFWSSALQTNKNVLPGWDANSIMTYYILLIILGAAVQSHIEEKIDVDIRQGNIINYLLKPFPFYWAMFLNELPYRLLQGGYAFLVYLVLAILSPVFRIYYPDFLTALLAILIVICAHFLMHTYKMILGMVTFWTTDNKGIVDTSTVVILFFAGFNLPLAFLPPFLMHVAYALPFSYFIYFPIISLQGKLAVPELTTILLTQLIWLGIFVVIYKIMLRYGLRKFTAVGQ